MAGVNLPNVEGMTSLTDLKNAVGKMNKELTWLLQNLDTRNVNELNAEVIVAGSITTGKLAANSVETDNLVAGAVTSDKITVNELSSITANLGHIISGLIESIKLVSSEIYGSLISTSEDSFPRSEMSNADHLFASYRNSSNFVKIQPNISGAPAIRFTSSDVVIGSLNSSFGYLEIWAPVILALTAQKVQLDTWYKLFNSDKANTLGDELDEIWEAINNKADINHSHSVTIPPGTAGGTFTVT